MPRRRMSCKGKKHYEMGESTFKYFVGKLPFDDVLNGWEVIALDGYFWGVPELAKRLRKAVQAGWIVLNANDPETFHGCTIFDGEVIARKLLRV